MSLLGLLAVVRHKDDPLKVAETYEKMGMHWKLDLTLNDGILAVGLCFPMRAPGPECPVLIFHNDPSFLGTDKDEFCFYVGNIHTLDENSKLPLGWKFKSMTQHPFFDYVTLISPDGDHRIGVDNIWQANHQRNGTVHNNRT